MQKRSPTAGWEAQLRNYKSSSTWSQQPSSGSPEREKSPTKPAHLTQSSSPSFLEAYAKYIEQQRDSDRARQSFDIESSVQIRAFSGGERVESGRNGSTDKRSPDTRRDTSDSSYSSWPASGSPASPGKTVAVTRATGISAESLPSPSTFAASRFRSSGNWQARSFGERSGSLTPEEQSPAKGAVAAVVDALEGRCRSPTPEMSSPLQGHPLISIPDTSLVNTADSGSAPASPWPDVQYQPTPRLGAQYTVEVCVVQPQSSNDADSVSAGGGYLGTGRARRGLETAEYDDKLARVLQERPDMREALLGLLEETDCNDSSLPRRVQELLKDHPEAVASLNTLYQKGAAPNTDLREALLSTSSVHMAGNGASNLSHRLEQQIERHKKYMVVMRGLNSTQLSGLQQQLGRRGVQLQTWNEFARWLVPPEDKRYVPWCTFLIIAAILSVFFFMAGGYSTFLQQTGQGAGAAQSYKPSELRHWMEFSASWHSFDFDYLLLWGGLYLPAICDHQAWRWITSAFLHVSFQHLLANMLLFAVLGGLLECRYGGIRMLLVLGTSTLGAAFFSGAFESPCTQVVGASGAVMGFVGLTIADLIVNFGGLLPALLRLVIIAASVVFFIVTAVTKAGSFTSNWSHLGGFVCGLFPSFLFLPSFKDRRWKRAHKLAARLGIAVPQRPQNQCKVRSDTIQLSAQAGDPTISGPVISAAAEGGKEGGMGVPTDLLSPHPMRSLAAWLDGPSSSLEQAVESTTKAPPAGGVPLVGLAQAVRVGTVETDGLPASDDAAPRVSNEASPVSSEQQNGARLFTEECSDASYLPRSLPPVRVRTRKASLLRQLRRSRSKYCSWNKAVLPCVLLGVFVIIGVFASLPTYVYLVRLPRAHCTT